MTQSIRTALMKLRDNLRVNNQLFPDYIYIYDPFVESDFKGITDTIANYAYMEPTQSDAIFLPGLGAGSHDFFKQEFKLIAWCTDCSKATLLEFCMNAVYNTVCCQILLATDQSERIYFEETEQELRRDATIIRIVFEVSVPISCSSKCIELCADPPCGPASENIPVAQGAPVSANPVSTATINPIEGPCIDCISGDCVKHN